MKKYSLLVKCITFALCVVLLLGMAISGLGVLLAVGMGMYNHTDYNTWLTDNYYQIAENIAYDVLQGYGTTLSKVPQWLLEQTGYAYAYPIENVSAWYDLAGNEWYYIIADSKGNVVAGSQSTNVAEPLVFGFENMQTTYLEIVGREERELPTTTLPVDWTESTDPSIEVPAATIVPSVDYAYCETYWDPYTGEAVYVQSHPVEGYNVTVGISKNYVGYRNYSGLPQEMLQWLFFARVALVAIIAVCFCLFVAAFVFMMMIAGKHPKTGEADPKALNRLPIDLYLAAAIGGTALGFLAAYELMDLLFYEKGGYNILIIILLCGCGIGVATLDMGFFTALAAQWKVKNSYWWYNSIAGRLSKMIWKFARFCWRGFTKLLALLPVIWEWLLIGFILGFGLFVIMLIGYETNAWLFVLWWCGIGVTVIGYGSYCYGTIRKGIKRMKEGNLSEKINTEWMLGSFKSVAEDLNALADVAAVAAEKQLRSERMKTELITNVSHDIKTPLTSVINYVDLLQQPHTEEEGQQYLEVLSRQSLRLKKLVEDLMDMSKASTGNVAVNITTVDAVEAVNQALGEFADKLEKANLVPVFRASVPQIMMKADGRLTWRVLSNVLSNVVKYALPGTRVYIDLLQVERQVVLSVKNISREELNISADELTERFVRGDASRNTEGSGLGLNIAQSLMQLQHGSLRLTVDGDLFKVTLTFPTE